MDTHSSVFSMYYVKITMDVLPFSHCFLLIMKTGIDISLEYELYNFFIL